MNIFFVVRADFSGEQQISYRYRQKVIEICDAGDITFIVIKKYISSLKPRDTYYYGELSRRSLHEIYLNEAPLPADAII